MGRGGGREGCRPVLIGGEWLTVASGRGRWRAWLLWKHCEEEGETGGVSSHLRQVSSTATDLFDETVICFLLVLQTLH